MKHQTPKTKHRETFQLQASRNVGRSIQPFVEMNLMGCTDLLEVGTWCLFGVWVLVFDVLVSGAFSAA